MNKHLLWKGERIREKQHMNENKDAKRKGKERRDKEERKGNGERERGREKGVVLMERQIRSMPWRADSAWGLVRERGGDSETERESEKETLPAWRHTPLLPPLRHKYRQTLLTCLYFNAKAQLCVNTIRTQIHRKNWQPPFLSFFRALNHFFITPASHHFSYILYVLFIWH